MEFFCEEDKRSCSRHETIGIISNISDGESTFVGVVKDISNEGIRMSHLPASFNDGSERCYSIVNGPADDFALALHPRWVQTTHRGMYKTVGFSIETPPATWINFVGEMKEQETFWLLQKTA